MVVARIYTTVDGVAVPDLLRFGYDHISAAQALLKGNARHFDSACYLAHLGFELLMKVWHLHSFNDFANTHSLTHLWQKLVLDSEVKPLSCQDSKTLLLVDRYRELRYPMLNDPIEVGSDDSPKIDSLANAIYDRMPKSLRDIVAGLHWST